MGWNRLPNNGQHVPNHPEDADYILTTNREDRDAWLTSFYHNIKSPISYEPVDKLQELDYTSLETFKADYHARLPGYYETLLKIYAPPGTFVIRTEHLADDMTDFLSVVQRRVIRAMPRKNVTEPTQ